MVDNNVGCVLRDVVEVQRVILCLIAQTSEDATLLEHAAVD